MAAALKHLIVPRHGIFRRMLPLMKSPLALALLVPCFALAAPFAYVSNEGSGTVSVVDTATGTVVDTLETGA